MAGGTSPTLPVYRKVRMLRKTSCDTSGMGTHLSVLS